MTSVLFIFLSTVGVHVRELLPIINSMSVFVFIVMSLLSVGYRYFRLSLRSKILTDNNFWYVAVYAYGAGASVWASGMTLLFEKIWMYPLTMGLCIGAMTYATYARRAIIDYLDEN